MLLVQTRVWERREELQVIGKCRRMKQTFRPASSGGAPPACETERWSEREREVECDEVGYIPLVPETPSRGGHACARSPGSQCRCGARGTAAPRSCCLCRREQPTGRSVFGCSLNVTCKKQQQQSLLWKQPRWKNKALSFLTATSVVVKITQT